MRKRAVLTWSCVATLTLAILPIPLAANARVVKPPVTYTLMLKSGDLASAYQDTDGYWRDPVNVFTYNTYNPYLGIPESWVTGDSYLIPTDPYWVEITGTSWISCWTDPSTPFGWTGELPTYYDTEFTLPKNFKTPTMNLQLLVDDAAYVFINGVLVVDQFTDGSPIGNNFGAIRTYNITNPALFRTGVNTIRIEQYDLGGSGGVAYLATVSYQK